MRRADICLRLRGVTLTHSVGLVGMHLLRRFYFILFYFIVSQADLQSGTDILTILAEQGGRCGRLA